MRVTTDTAIHLHKTWADPELRRVDVTIGAGDARFVVISDLHRGIGDGADDFLLARPAVLTALRHYLDDGFTLIVLGDAEELWEVPESRWSRIFRVHEASYALEAEFHRQGRYHRVFGNHDLPWADPDLVKRHLHPILPDLVVHEAVVITVMASGIRQGEIQLLHGHQGEFFSDQLRVLSRFFVREVWAGLQRLTRIRSTKFNPVTDVDHPRDQAIFFDWAVTRDRAISVTGHTHRLVLHDPADEGLLHELERHVDKLKRRHKLAERDAQLAHQIRTYLDLWTDRVRRVGLPDGPPHVRAAFFNTGCCCYGDGRMSALEIADGEIRIVTWEGDENGEIGRRSRAHTGLLHALSSTIGGIDAAAWSARGLRVVVSE